MGELRQNHKLVMAGLVPAIHVIRWAQFVDARHKAGLTA
jgi:hypothetical protein